MKNIIVSLVIIYLTTVYSTCEKVVREPDKYTFEMTATFSPDLDSMPKGDTILLTIEGAQKQADQNSGVLIDFSNAQNLSTSIYFDKLAFDSTRQSKITVSSDKFLAKVVNGSEAISLDPSRIKQFKFAELNGSYLLKVKLIPLDTGIYTISLQDLPLIYRNSDRNTKATYFVTVTNTNQHIYFMKDYYPNFTIDDTESRHVFSFNVY